MLFENVIMEEIKERSRADCPLLLFVIRKKNMGKPEKAEERRPLLFSVYGSRKPQDALSVLYIRKRGIYHGRYSV